MANNNVFFKLGKQSAYNGLTSRDAGTFYVTSDTHRLYLGDNLLSQAVEVLKKGENLPSTTDSRVAAGTIFYLEDRNILAIYDSVKGKWTQLNPDTYIDSVSMMVSAGETTDAELVLQINQNNDKAAISKTIKLDGANGITVSAGEADTLIISAPELGAAANGSNGALINLDDNNVYFEGGNNLTVSYADGKISLNSSYTDHEITGGNIFISPAAEKAPGFDFDGTLSHSINGQGQAAPITITGGNFDPVIAAISSIDSEGTAHYGEAVHFINGKAELDVYDTAKVDALIKTAFDAVNAMTYKGTITDTSKLVNDGTVQAGDTYIAASEITFNGTPYLPGTLFIAKGTEVNGLIPAGDTVWESVVTSDHDTTYKMGSYESSNTFYLQQTNGNDISNVGEIKVVGDNDSISATFTKDSNSATVITVAHKDVNVAATTLEAATQQSGENKTLTIVEAIRNDGNGHITEVQTRDVTLVDTVVKLKTNGITDDEAIANGRKVNLMVSAQDQNTNNGSSAEVSFSLASETLAITGDGAGAIKAELTWGTF